MHRTWCVTVAVLVAPFTAALAQDGMARPRPYPPFESRGFSRAVDNGTRTRTGAPGPKYWTQYARYTLAATLDPAAHRLTGRGTIVYLNRSPDSLSALTFQLIQNLHAPGGVRSEEVDVTKGMELTRLVIGGRQVIPDSGARIPIQKFGTVMVVGLPRAIPAGDSVTIEAEWGFDVPQMGPRMGRDESSYYLAYWYPQLAVYDDVQGWVRYPHMSTSEFYMDYADYDVALTLPAGWLVGATGTLTNADEVLSRQTRDRLTQARRGNAVVRVVTAADRGAGRATAAGTNGMLTWRFRATNVRDFAWGTSDQYLWDATWAFVGDFNGDRKPDSSTIYAFYRPDRTSWVQGARYAKFSIEFLSRFLWPYPYPTMTAVEGQASCGGMEYPMMTCIGGMRDTMSLFGVTVHELAHMWFPMQVGSNEQAHSWQDEGLTTYNATQGTREFYNRADDRSIFGGYIGWARTGNEVEIMRHGEQYPLGTAAYGVASYAKPASVLRMLRGLVGDDAFLKAYREYGRAWVNKHPTPWDLFNTFNTSTGRDLSWFWRTWFFETWTLDQALGGVRAVGDSLEIEVQDRGLAPMPARVVVTRADGTSQRLEVPVEVWLGGSRSQVVRVANPATVTKVEIDPDQAFADVDRTNQVWQKP